MISYLRPTVTASVIAPLLATFSSAQSLTWWDILSPDRVMETLTRYAVILARTQVDLTFEDISTNLRSNRTTISNLRMWPATPWHGRGTCQVSIERVTINGQAFDNLDNATVKIDAFDAAVTPDCLPPELRAGLERLELEDLSLPSISIHVGYHIPSSRAKVSILASVTDVVEATAAADFDYVSIRTPSGRGDPYPIAALSKASVELHNLGGWKAVSQILPPAFTQEDSAAAAVETVLRTAFAELNRNSYDLRSEELSVLQLALISSMTTAWTEFLRSPKLLVLETNIAADRPVFLNFRAYEENPSWIVRDLNPVMRAAMSPVPKVPSRDAIDAVLSGAWRDLPDEERLNIGLALARGDGVPRNRALASDILEEFAGDGNAEAAAAIAEVLEAVDPETAYFWSLHAGASGASGATSRLDRLEGVLSLPTVLRLQSQFADSATDEAELPTSIVGIRARARDHLTGIGAHRDYQAALTWASVGAALDDPASVALGDEIAKTLDAAQDSAAKAAVAELRRQSDSDALDLWPRLIPMVGAPRQVSGGAQPAMTAEANEASTMPDEELENCRKIVAARIPGNYEIGGSCSANNAVLLRELASALRQQDQLRNSVLAPVDADLPPAQVSPEVVAPETEAVPDRMVSSPTERAAVEAALALENQVLQEELAAITAQLAEGERRVALSNEQVAALRSELTSLQSLLDFAASRDQETQVQIEALGSQLNAALARVAAEERQRAELAEAEARRLAKEAARAPLDADVLEQVWDDFLADLGGVLANRADVSVFDDRVVFSSGALFRPGSTTLSANGRAQIAEVMDRFANAAGRIPPSVDWIIRIDGHTDDVPISSSAFADNWELSQARALSVVRYLTDELAVPPERLAAVGFGEFRPVNSSNTAEARAQNRRIELLLTTR